MPQFTYRALDPDKQMKTGDIDAPTRGDAILLLRQQKLQPLDVTLRTTQASTDPGKVSDRGAPLSIGQQMLFFTTLQQTQHAGIPLVSSFAMLATQSRGNLRDIAYQMQLAMTNGESLSQLMTRFEGRFSPPCPALIRAGEVSGKVPEMAAECTQWLATITVARRQAITELIYPAIMLVFALFVPVIVYLVLANLGQTMAIDQTIFGGSRSAVQVSVINGLWLIGIIALILVLRRLSNHMPGVKNAIDTFTWNFPIYNSMERSGAQSRFLHALGSLYHAGLPPAQCLEYAAQAAGQMVIKKRVLAQVDAVRNGGSLATGLLVSDTMPVAVTSQLMVAETSGKMDESLVRLSAMMTDIHRNAVRRVLIITGVLGLLYAMGQIIVSIIGLGKGIGKGFMQEINTIEQ